MQGTFLVLEKLRDVATRALFRKTHAFCAAKHPQKANQVSLHVFAKALAWCGAEMDIDEVECVVANLIFRKCIKGYVSHKSRSSCSPRRAPSRRSAEEYIDDVW